MTSPAFAESPTDQKLEYKAEEFPGDDGTGVIGYNVGPFRYYETTAPVISDPDVCRKMVTTEPDRYLRGILTTKGLWRWSFNVATHDVLYRADRSMGDIAVRLQSKSDYVDDEGTNPLPRFEVRSYEGWEAQGIELGATLQNAIPGADVSYYVVEPDPVDEPSESAA